MRWLAGILVLLVAIGAARADIRVDESRYANGKLIVAGVTAPNRTVTLDGTYETKSDGVGNFTFNVDYKPHSCMSDIRAGDDVYSAVIAGCLDTGDVDGPLPKETVGQH
jgi:hypothetical protein